MGTPRTSMLVRSAEPSPAASARSAVLSAYWKVSSPGCNWWGDDPWRFCIRDTAPHARPRVGCTPYTQPSRCLYSRSFCRPRLFPDAQAWNPEPTALAANHGDNPVCDGEIHRGAPKNIDQNARQSPAFVAIRLWIEFGWHARRRLHLSDRERQFPGFYIPQAARCRTGLDAA